jgi:hypothetical protein
LAASNLRSLIMYSYSFAATPAKGTYRRGNMSNLRIFIVLGVTTWAFVVCFAVWLMFGVIGIPIKNELGLNGLNLVCSPPPQC